MLVPKEENRRRRKKYQIKRQENPDVSNIKLYNPLSVICGLGYHDVVWMNSNSFMPVIVHVCISCDFLHECILSACSFPWTMIHAHAFGDLCYYDFIVFLHLVSQPHKLLFQGPRI